MFAPVLVLCAALASFDPYPWCPPESFCLDQWNAWTERAREIRDARAMMGGTFADRWLDEQLDAERCAEFWHACHDVRSSYCPYEIPEVFRAERAELALQLWGGVPLPDWWKMTGVEKEF